MGLTARALLAAILAASIGAPATGQPAPPSQLNPAPTAKDWADIAKLPDFSGVWTPNISDQVAQIARNPTPWTPAAARQVAQLDAEEKAGNPRGLFIDCLPEGMPSWMLISHNAFEFAITPRPGAAAGRIRQQPPAPHLHTDGRPHPDDPDLTFHGDSIGHWEGDALVVDTVGILPEVYLAVSEAVGVPNNGDMHVVERIHLAGPDELHDDLEITAPHVLSRPWTTTRIYYRQRARKFDIVEGVCLQGGLSEQTDKDGNAVFVPIPHDQGIPVPHAP